MIVTIFFMLLFAAAFCGLGFSIANLIRIPKEKREERLKYKILLGVCIFVVAIYAAVFVFLIVLMAHVAVHGM